MATNFESMSNELLMDLFEYYDLYALLISFSSLNSRIDHLLRHSQVDQSSCRNLKKPAGFGDFRVGSRRFSPLPTVSEPFLTGSLPPDFGRIFSDNSGNFPVGLQPDLSGTYRNR